MADTISPAVVTGGGSGIGSMIASAYVQNGAKVYIASRKEKQLKEVNILRHTKYIEFLICHLRSQTH